MKLSLKKLGLTGFFLSALPGLAFASTGFQSGLDLIKDLFNCGGICGDQTFSQLLLDIIQLLLVFAGPVAVLFVIIAGYFYITAGGNEEQAEKGKKALVNSVIGIVIIMLSYTIVTVIQNTVTGP